jgi:hydroxymethylpyrimidine kinase/phosphomethylpyrimidine kinase
MSVLTLLTVQNTRSVDAVEPLAPGFVLAQLDSVLEDIPPHAAKTGALGTREIIEAIARRAAHFSFPLVVDPVMISKHGAPLLPEEAQKTLVRELLPHAALVTPNLYEASVLSGRQIKDPSSMESAAKDIAQLGPRAVLIKGGHLSGEALTCCIQMGYFTRSPLRASRPHTPMVRDVHILPLSLRNWPRGLAWWQRSKRRRDTSRGLSKQTLLWAAALDRSITMPKPHAGHGMRGRGAISHSVF